jgi:hypothetical protein
MLSDNLGTNILVKLSNKYGFDNFLLFGVHRAGRRRERICAQNRRTFRTISRLDQHFPTDSLLYLISLV